MSSDPISSARLVHREVLSATREGRPTRIAVARRTYPTDVADLWDALTDPERIPRWFSRVTGDLQLGGRFQIEGNAAGVIQRCEAPESFAITWEFGGETSWVSVTLTPDDGGTTLELRHEALFDPDADFGRRFGPGAVGVGWDLSLVALGVHVETGESLDPAEWATWSLTPPGVELVRTAASEWGEAAIAAGDDPDLARAAVENTIAFYTTMPDQEPAQE